MFESVPQGLVQESKVFVKETGDWRSRMVWSAAKRASKVGRVVWLWEADGLTQAGEG